MEADKTVAIGARIDALLAELAGTQSLHMDELVEVTLDPVLRLQTAVGIMLCSRAGLRENNFLDHMIAIVFADKTVIPAIGSNSSVAIYRSKYSTAIGERTNWRAER